MIALRTLVAALLFPIVLGAGVDPLWGDAPPLLTLNPWSTAAIAQTWDHPLEENKGWIRNDGQSAHVFWYNSYGRIRLNRQTYAPTLGYRVLYIDLGTHDPLLPTQLTDQSLVLGAPLWASHGWRLGAIAGAGYAGNSPFGDTRAIYGMGHLQLTRTLSAHESVYITLDYNGHGALLPDVPLPGFGWQYHSRALSGLAGFPTDSLQWRPLPRWRLNASYNVPFDGSAMLRYRVAHGLYAFGDFQNYLEGFQLNAYPDNTRLFMQFSRLEAGLRVIHEPWVDISVAVGYAFNQEFMRGFDIRSLAPVAQMANQPFVALEIRGYW